MQRLCAAAPFFVQQPSQDRTLGFPSPNSPPENTGEIQVTLPPGLNRGEGQDARPPTAPDASLEFRSHRESLKSSNVSGRLNGHVFLFCSELGACQAM